MELRDRTCDPKHDPILRAASLSSYSLKTAIEAEEATRLAVALLDVLTDEDRVSALSAIVGKAERATVYASNLTTMLAALGKVGTMDTSGNEG